MVEYFSFWAFFGTYRRWLSKSRRCNVVTSQRRDVNLSPLWNVATLAFNVATLVLHLSGTLRRWIIPFSGTSRRWLSTSQRWLSTSRRWLSTSRRWFYIALERRDVGSQRRDVGFYHSLERRDVGSQRRDVGLFPLWNIATLHPNVATFPCLRPNTPHFFILPCILLA